MTIDIPKLRTLCNTATPGPWSSNRYPAVIIAIVEGENRQVELCAADAAGRGDDVDASAVQQNNANFIIAAREALPAALDEIERLRIALMQALNEWDELSANCDCPPDRRVVRTMIDELRKLVARDRIDELRNLVTPSTVCKICNDTHQMWLTSMDCEVPCTRCPLPCDSCRGYLSPYCATTPCGCDCHRF